MFAPYRYSRDVGIGLLGQCVSTFSALDRPPLIEGGKSEGRALVREYKVREKVCTSMAESIINKSNVDESI